MIGSMFTPHSDKVCSLDGAQEIETYALLDDGSDVSLYDSALVKKFGISGAPTAFSLTTVNVGTKNNYGEEVRIFVSDLSKASIPTADDVAQWSHLDGLEF